MSSRYPEPSRRAALTRLFAFYTATAWRSLALLRPHDHRLVSADARWTGGGLAVEDVPAALAWLETERANLLSAVEEVARAAPAIPAGLASQLAMALFGFFEGRGYWSDCVQVNQTVVDLAGRVGDRAALAHAKNDLAGAYGRFGRYPETPGMGTYGPVRAVRAGGPSERPDWTRSPAAASRRR